MSIIGSNVLAGASGQAGYNLNNSLRFRSSASAYLSRTMNASSTTFTVSCWVKRGALGTYQYIFSSGPNTAANDKGLAYNDTTNTIYIYNGSTQVASTAVYRDPSAWYHVVMSVSSGTAKVYINGNDIGLTHTSMSLGTYGKIGRYNDTNLNQFDGYLADYNCIDGQALTPSSFGETSTTTGTWIPKAYSGSYGTNGFYLNFSDTSAATAAAIGKDSSGNGNNWTPSGISVTAGTTYDAMIDVPTNTSATVANYAVLNSTIKLSSGSITEANLKGAGSDYECWGTIAFPSTGKFYFEYTHNATTGAGNGPGIGIQGINPPDIDYGVHYHKNGNKWVNGTSSAYGATYTSGDVIGVAYDATSNSITFYKNNVSQGAISTTSGYTYLPYQFDNSGSGGYLNFGQRPFTYTPPSGYVALNTYNLPTTTILQGNKYMDATLYTQNGAASNVIVNAGQFKPDFVWIKCRSNAGTWNALVDSVRGGSKTLYSNATNAESTDNFINTFNSNGFTLNIGDSGTNNTSGRTQVAWNWQAGQGTTSSDTSGSITSTVSVNATAGFSIVTYTGNATNPSTVGHGLGVAPKMIITKQRNAGTYAWNSYHASLGNTQYVALNTTDAASSAVSLWNNTSPTSTVFTINHAAVNSATTYVAYCWAAISGFSAFGSYTGNGSADGPFVYLGFRPKYVMIKCSSAAGNDWPIIDTSRATYNVAGPELYADLSQAESTSNYIDIVSNGFKIRSTGGQVNTSATTYIYAAFAESPFKNALAR